jgi:hypothetical protein
MVVKKTKITFLVTCRQPLPISSLNSAQHNSLLPSFLAVSYCSRNRYISCKYMNKIHFYLTWCQLIHAQSPVSEGVVMRSVLWGNFDIVQTYQKLTQMRMAKISFSHTIFCPFGDILFFSYFSDRILHFCPGLAQDHSLPTYASCLTGITQVYATMPSMLVEMGSP